MRENKNWFMALIISQYTKMEYSCLSMETINVIELLPRKRDEWSSDIHSNGPNIKSNPFVGIY